MITMVTYDITSPKRLNAMRKFMKEYGIRTQKSVFECDIDDEAIRRIRKYCKRNLDIATDSVRIYRICSRCINRVIISGQGLKITQLDYMIV
jgi:CRISPR-associated protein Cas2